MKPGAPCVPSPSFFVLSSLPALSQTPPLCLRPHPLDSDPTPLVQTPPLCLRPHSLDSDPTPFVSASALSTISLSPPQQKPAPLKLDPNAKPLITVSTLTGANNN